MIGCNRESVMMVYVKGKKNNLTIDIFFTTSISSATVLFEYSVLLTESLHKGRSPLVDNP